MIDNIDIHHRRDSFLSVRPYSYRNIQPLFTKQGNLDGFCIFGIISMNSECHHPKDGTNVLFRVPVEGGWVGAGCENDPDSWGNIINVVKETPATDNAAKQKSGK